MPSKVSICNMALGYLQHGIRIAALDEGSNEADQCSLYYEPALRSALRAGPWSFATQYATLANLGAPAAPGWTLMYAYPADAVAIRAILPVIRGTPPHRFRVARSAVLGRVILCDVGDAVAEYTAYVDDPNAYDPQFVTALAWQLASEMAPVLTGSPQAKAAADQQLARAINAAFVSNGSEGVGEPAVEAEWVRARFETSVMDNE
jgi:hypothetical protein